jgi:putative redox protein
MHKPPTSIRLTWTEGLAFRVDTADARTLMTDGNSAAGLSPVELLAAATASCMGVDLVHILTKAHQPIEAMRVAFRGERAQSEPHRFTAVRLEFTITGAVSQTHVDRAVQLSRDKYCSVWNSLREDTTLDVVTHIHASRAR